MTKLAILGSINVDHLLQVSHFPRPGETCSIEHYQTVAGGKGANQAVAAAKMGADTTFIACVGDDAAGSEMIHALSQTGIDTDCIDQLADTATGMAMIYVDGKGENNIGIWAGANAQLLCEKVTTHTSIIAESDTLLMQLETPLEGVEKAAKIAKQHGTKVVLNPAPAKALPEALLANVDMITPNETEAEILTGVHISTFVDADQAAQKLHRYGIKTVLITLGKRGVWLSDSGNGKHIAGFSVIAKDTTAAGDTFNGAYIAELIQGTEPQQALVFAQAAAAMSVTRLGAQSSIPTRNEVLEFLAQH